MSSGSMYRSSGQSHRQTRSSLKQQQKAYNMVFRSGANFEALIASSSDDDTEERKRRVRFAKRMLTLANKYAQHIASKRAPVKAQETRHRFRIYTRMVKDAAGNLMMVPMELAPKHKRPKVEKNFTAAQKKRNKRRADIAASKVAKQEHLNGFGKREL